MNDDALQDEINEELSWVCVGQIPGPDLDFKAREAIRTVLARHGLKARRIVATSSPAGIDVRIELPKQPPRITSVRLRMR